MTGSDQNSKVVARSPMHPTLNRETMQSCADIRRLSDELFTLAMSSCDPVPRQMARNVCRHLGRLIPRSHPNLLLQSAAKFAAQMQIQTPGARALETPLSLMLKTLCTTHTLHHHMILASDLRATLRASCQLHGHAAFSNGELCIPSAKPARGRALREGFQLTGWPF
jgi:hypothetical protein